MKSEIDDYLKEIEQLKNVGWLNCDFKISAEIIDCIKSCESPKKRDIFNAFKLFGPNETKVLILGQDPYPPKIVGNKAIIHAHGYAFSSNNADIIPDSLENIFIAIKNCKKSINLENWSKENKVLLLNSSLTYQGGTQKFHNDSWKSFIKKIFSSLLTSNNKPLVVFLWGNLAKQTFLDSINEIEIKRKILVLTTSHPSNLSVGCGFRNDAPKHFKICNDFLLKNNEKVIDWKKF